MGKPKSAKATTISENYNWGPMGSADASGVNLSPTASSNVSTAQTGISQYLDELINPSYNSQSFRARQEMLDESNRQYANELGANAIARGARGSATQNILASVMANRNNDMRTAMTGEDERIKSILASLSGVESNYFNQANTMANNILSRVQGNQAAKNAVATYNTNAYNTWKNNLLGGAASLAGTLGGAIVGGPVGAAIGSRLMGSGVGAYSGGVTNDGMYGAYMPEY